MFYADLEEKMIHSEDCLSVKDTSQMIGLSTATAVESMVDLGFSEHECMKKEKIE